MTREHFEIYINNAEFANLEELTFLRAYIREKMEINFESKLELRDLSTGLFLIHYIESAFNWGQDNEDVGPRKLIADEIIFLLNDEDLWAEFSNVLIESFLVENDTSFENNIALFGWYYNNHSKVDRVEEVLKWSLEKLDEEIVKNEEPIEEAIDETISE